jgi:predicted RNA-binding Zn-ribbon protein involved in translation (DUF1610 family)
MESRDHLKNGASLKSLMSKKNNLNKILFTFIILLCSPTITQAFTILQSNIGDKRIKIIRIIILIIIVIIIPLVTKLIKTVAKNNKKKKLIENTEKAVELSNTKECPYCGKEILTAAKKCKHCYKLLDNINEEKTIDKLLDSNTKNCPYCGEEILTVAKKCKHCGEWLNNTNEIK